MHGRPTWYTDPPPLVVAAAGSSELIEVPLWAKKCTIYGEDGIAGAAATVSLVWSGQAPVALVAGATASLLSSPAPYFTLPVLGQSCAKRQLRLDNQAVVERTFILCFR